MFRHSLLAALIIMSVALLYSSSALAISIGDRVQTTGSPNVRQSAAGTPYANGQPQGALGIAVDGPTSATLNGTLYVWWNINFDTGQDGWVADINLQSVSPTTPTSPSPGTTSSPGPTQTSSTVTMSWGASTGATSYGIGVVDIATGLLVVDAYPHSTSYTATLTPGKQYKWNVAAIDSAGSSAYTTRLYFQTPSSGPVLSVNPLNSSVSSSAGSTSISVSNTGGGTMSYSASVTSGSSWLSIASGGSGGNSGTIIISYASNGTGTQRSGTIQVTASGATGSPMSVTITQTTDSGSNILLGIDVSHWQGTVDWNLVKQSGRDFAFIKASESVDYEDSNFTTNIVAAKNAGLKVAPYHFARPSYGNTPESEADYFVYIAGTYISSNYLRPVLDWEDEGSLDMSNAEMTDWINRWAAELRRLTGVDPILYMDSRFVSLLSSPVTSFPLWYANPGTSASTQPTNVGNFQYATFKQYDWHGSVAGVAGEVDLDAFYGNLAALNSFVIGSGATSSITYVTPSPASGSTAVVGQSDSFGVSVSYNVTTAGYLQVWVYDSNGTDQKIGQYISAAQTSSATISGFSLTSGSAGSKTYTILTQFRPGATGGPLLTSQAGDVVSSQSYTVNWQSAASQVNLTPYQPAGWSDKIVVTRATGATYNSAVDATNLTTADTLYVDWAVISNGSQGIAISFITALYVDGVSVSTGTTASLPSGSYIFGSDWPIDRKSVV